MSELLLVLKTEVTRLARKEIKRSMETLQAAVSRQRREIIALKAEVASLKKLTRDSVRRPSKSVTPSKVEAAATTKRRFSPARLANQRQRLGLSAAAFGKLIGVSATTVYNWESGEFRPRPHQLESIAHVRQLRKSDLKLAN